MIAELGVVIYNALDFGNKTEEERQLSPELEHIIDILTSAGKCIFCNHGREEERGVSTIPLKDEFWKIFPFFLSPKEGHPPDASARQRQGGDIGI